MIKTFRSKALQAYFRTGKAAKLPVQKTTRLSLILDTLNKAAHPRDMDVPGFRFHALKGPMAGRYSVWLSGNWRVSFGWEDGPVNVDLEDYH